MDIAFIIQAVQVVSAVLLIIAILLLRSEASVGGAFGGDNITEGGGVRRRGSEKIMFIGTVILAVVFVVSIALPLVV